MSYTYQNFSSGRGWKFKRTREEYTTTASGNFKSKPNRVETDTVDGEFYVNFVRAVPFFNHPGYGESCRVTWSYTPAGYIPTRIVTSKRGYKKYVDTFVPVAD